MKQQIKSCGKYKFLEVKIGTNRTIQKATKDRVVQKRNVIALIKYLETERKALIHMYNTIVNSINEKLRSFANQRQNTENAL